MAKYDAFGFEIKEEKKPLWKKWWFWVLIIAVAFFAYTRFTGGGNEEQGDGTYDFEFEDGVKAEGIMTGDFAFAVLGAEVRQEVGRGVHVRKPLQGAFLIVELAAFNNKNEIAGLNDGMLHIVDEKGNKYMHSIAAKTSIDFTEEPYLYSKQMRGKGTSRGILAFDVPADIVQGKLQLLYQPTGVKFDVEIKK